MTSLIEILLIEGRYDYITTYISKLIVSMIKNTDKYDTFDVMFKTVKDVDGVEVPLIISVDVSIIYNKKFKLDFDMYATSSDDDIKLELVINPNSLPQSLSEIIATLKETIRHELEHVAQFNDLRPDSESFEKIIKAPGDPESKMAQYLLLKHEVPAFVRGLYKKAKTIKKPLDIVIDDFFKDYKSRLKKSDIPRIKKVWIQYAKQKLPKAIWSK
jgi:hypothetical protein